MTTMNTFSIRCLSDLNGGGASTRSSKACRIEFDYVRSVRRNRGRFFSSVSADRALAELSCASYSQFSARSWSSWTRLMRRSPLIVATASIHSPRLPARMQNSIASERRPPQAEARLEHHLKRSLARFCFGAPYDEADGAWQRTALHAAGRAQPVFLGLVS